MLVAEEQPGMPAHPGRRAFLQEGTERGDAGAGADHDDGDGRVRRQAEMAGLDACQDLPVHRRAVGEERAGDTVPHPAAPLRPHHANAEMHLAGFGPQRGRDRIQPRFQCRHGFNQVKQTRPGGGERLQQVRVLGLRAVLAVGQAAEGGGLYRNGGVGQQQHRAVERAGDVHLPGECLAHGAHHAVRAGHQFVTGGTQRLEAQIHQRRVIRGVDADGVARFVDQAGGG